MVGLARLSLAGLLRCDGLAADDQRKRYPDELKQQGPLLRDYADLGSRLLELLQGSDDAKDRDLREEVEEEVEKALDKLE